MKTTTGLARLAAFATVLLTLAGCDDPVRSGAPIARIEVDAEMVFLDVGEVLQLTATALTAAGDPVPGARIEWESSAPDVASVKDGRVQGLAPGSVTILASSRDVKGALGLTVQTPATHFSVAPQTLNLAPGRQARIVPRLQYADPSSPTHALRFVSSAPAVAEVSDSGVVVAKSAGTATITVAAGSRRLEVPVTVEAPYTLTYLGGAGVVASVANAINASGQVVGRIQVEDGNWHAALWKDGQLTDLGSLGFPYNDAVAINDGGMVVGTAADRTCVDCGPILGGNRKQPWKWENGTVTPLAIEPSSEVTILTDVNNRGQVTGYTYGGYYRFAMGDAFIWQDGETTWIGKHGGALASGVTGSEAYRGIAAAINDAGFLVGSMVYYGLEEHPIGWKAGTFLDAGPVHYGVTRAVDVNKKGQVVGIDRTSDCGVFLWESGTTNCLARLPFEGAPTAINDRGHIVGTTGESAFLWRDGRMIDLNGLVSSPDWVLVSANGINNDGVIVGYGRNKATGATGAILLTPPR